MCTRLGKGEKRGMKQKIANNRVDDQIMSDNNTKTEAKLHKKSRMIRNV